MIEPTKKRLTTVFTLVIVVFHVLLFILTFFYLHYSLMDSIRSHVENDIRTEFIPHVRQYALSRIQELREDESYQVYSRDGRLIAVTPHANPFDAPVDPGLLSKAFEGARTFQSVRYGNLDYIVAYFPIDTTMAGRAAMPLTSLIEYERNFMKLVLICLPFTLLGSFFVSRYLVHQAMKPIHEVFTFQENFSSNVSHELRSPLASLKGNLEVALRKDRSTEAYRKALSMGLHEVDRIINLLNNLYILASSKFKPLDLLCEKSDMKALIEDIVHKSTAEDTIHTVTIDWGDRERYDISCDETLMRRALENLIDNAVKYTPAGGEIRICLKTSNSDFVFEIENPCLPITASETAEFCQPFYRGQSARNSDIEGKGLGLYIARYIVRSHGGDIIVRNTDQNTFHVEMIQPVNNA